MLFGYLFDPYYFNANAANTIRGIPFVKVLEGG